MSNRVGIIDIATSAIRGLSKGLSTLHGIHLKEFPSIISEPVIIPKLVGVESDLVALFHVNHPASSSDGFVSLFIEKDRLKGILESGGTSEPSESELKESWGELCRFVAGAMKMELKNMGHDSVDISSPTSFTDGVNITIENVDVNQKYNLSTEYEGKSLIQMQIAFQCLSEKESLQT
ncbi:MAG: hypothetical protein KC649_05650 [Candidatus Omnitrophica bacterium]|nr:hypothetical protein [Candidatus Omnitrophota bacterium]